MLSWGKPGEIYPETVNLWQDCNPVTQRILFLFSTLNSEQNRPVTTEPLVGLLCAVGTQDDTSGSLVRLF